MRVRSSWQAPPVSARLVAAASPGSPRAGRWARRAAARTDREPGRPAGVKEVERRTYAGMQHSTSPEVRAARRALHVYGGAGVCALCGASCERGG
jgi:hypothetical protein